MAAWDEHVQRVASFVSPLPPSGLEKLSAF
jgi:hypothetical protein